MSRFHNMIPSSRERGDPNLYLENLQKFYAALNDRQHDVVQELLWSYPGFRGAVVDASGEVPIHKVCKTDDVEMARILLHRDDAIYGDVKGNTPLNLACVHGQIEMVKFLIGKDQDVNLPNNQGQTAFHIAHAQNNEELIRVLEPHVRPEIRREFSKIDEKQQTEEELQKEQAAFVEKEEKRKKRLEEKKSKREVKSMLKEIILELEEREGFAGNRREVTSKVATSTVNKILKVGVKNATLAIEDQIQEEMLEERKNKQRLDSSLRREMEERELQRLAEEESKRK